MGDQEETDRGDGDRPDLSGLDFTRIEFKAGDFTIFDDEPIASPIEVMMRSFIWRDAVNGYMGEMRKRMLDLKESEHESFDKTEP